MIGQNGDFYLNSATGDIFKKINGIWVKIGNFKGPPFTPIGWTGVWKSGGHQLTFVNGICTAYS